MYRCFKCFSFSILFCLIAALGYSQRILQHLDNVVQITGTTMTADSLKAVPNVIITVRNKNIGVISNGRGLFSIACQKGDTLEFNALGFRDKEYVISEDIQGKYFNMVQLMVQDTFYLPETIIRPIPYGKAFDYAFKYWNMDEDQYAIAKQNMNERIRLQMLQSLPKNGVENQAAYQLRQAQESYYYGQQKPMNILSPFNWIEFIEAWKRGDFRKKQ